jgi:hypothetical protein
MVLDRHSNSPPIKSIPAHNAIAASLDDDKEAANSKVLAVYMADCITIKRWRMTSSIVPACLPRVKALQRHRGSGRRMDIRDLWSGRRHPQRNKNDNLIAHGYCPFSE